MSEKLAQKRFVVSRLVNCTFFVLFCDMRDFFAFLCFCVYRQTFFAEKVTIFLLRYSIERNTDMYRGLYYMNACFEGLFHSV